MVRIVSEVGEGYDLLPLAPVVEEVLGTRLLPQNVSYELTDDPERPDIRLTVHNLVAHVVQNVARRKVWEPNDDGLYLSERNTSAIASRSGDLIVQARRQIIIANNVAESLSRPAFRPPGADTPDRPRSLLQSKMGAVIYDFVQRPHPLKIPGLRDEGPIAALQSGLLIVSATATGKSVPPAELAGRARVGEPFSATDTEQNRMLFVVPSIDLADDYLDPDGTLRSWLPGVEVSEYSHRRKKVGAPIQLILNDSLPAAIASGAIDLKNYPIRVVDEGHHASSPKMLRELGGLAAGRLILCTATPREMRRFFVDFTASTPRTAAEQGITRPVRLATYQYGPEKGGPEVLMARLATEVIKAGKQVAVYCKPIRGRPGAQQAQDVARLINSMNLDLSGVASWEGGEYVRVIAGVEGEAENARAKADYKAGRLRGYVVVGMLSEGTTMPMDVLIVHPGNSQDRLDQIVGRLPRPILGSEDPYQEGLIIEVQPREVPSGEPLASIWRTYGLTDSDEIDQGRRFGPEEDLQDDGLEVRASGEDAEAGAAPANEPAADTLASEPEASPPPRPRGPTTSSGRPRRTWIDAFIGAEDTAGFLAASAIALRSVTIAPEDWGKYETPVPGSMRLAELAERYNVPEIWLQRKLDMWSTQSGFVSAAGRPLTISYVGVRTKDPDAEDDSGRGEYERWYGPDTVVFLEENRPTPLANAERMDITDIAEMCGVTRSFVETIIARLELPHELLLGKSHRPTMHYAMPEINRIAAEITKVPVADPETEEALSDLGQELEQGFVYVFTRIKRNNITLLERRRHPDSGIRGYARHVSKEDAARIRDAFYNPPLAGEDKISYVEMARMAGVTLGAMIKRIEKIPEDEAPDVFMLKTNNRGRMAAHLDRDVGLAIVGEVQIKKLPPDRVTLGMLSEYFDSFRKTITVRIATLARHGVLTAEEAAAEPINLGGQGGLVSTWSWRVMQVLEEKGEMALRNPSDPVDYGLTARGAYDADWQYSQQTQVRLAVASDKLVKLPPRDRLLHIGARHKVGEGSITVDAYAQSRGVAKADILRAVADDAIGGAVLYYRDSETPGDPEYVIDQPEIASFDRYFRPAADMVAAAQASVATATEPVEEEEPATTTAAVATTPLVTIVAPEPVRVEVADHGPKIELADAEPKVAQVVPVIETSDAVTPVAEAPATAVAPVWKLAADVIAELKCSHAAFAHMLAISATPGQMRRQDESGPLELDSTLVAKLLALRKRIQPSPDDWIRHGRLAQEAGVAENELVALMRRHNVYVTDAHVRLIRLYSSSVEYDLAYGPHVWKRFLTSLRAKRTQG